MKTIPRAFLLCLLGLWTLGFGLGTCRGGNFHVQWIFRDSISNVLALKVVWIQPLQNYGTSGSYVLTGDRITKTSRPDGSLIVSNLFNGRCYRVEILGPYIHTVFTNCFGTNVTGLVNGADPTYLPGITILNNNILAWSQAASDLRYLRTNVDRYVMAGTNVTFTTNVAGQLTISASAGGNGAWETDLSGGLMPVDGPFSDALWRDDDDGNLEPL